MTSKRKAGWKLLAYAFVLAMGSCILYMTVLVPKFLKPNLFMFDTVSTIDESYRNAHQLYERPSPLSHHRSVEVQTKTTKLHDASNVYKWWDVSPLLHRRNQGASFIIKQPKQALKQWKGDVNELKTAAEEAMAQGRKTWKELLDMQKNGTILSRLQMKEDCPGDLSLEKAELERAGRLVVLPCGLQMGSSITVVAKPEGRHMEYLKGDVSMPVMVRQFIIELQARKAGRTEEPPRVLHINPRISGDWSGKPVIEVNSCFHGKWGVSQRCEGKVSEDKVDGLPECEEWAHEKGEGTSKEPENLSWLTALFGNSQNEDYLWSFPFTDERFFVMTIRAGWEGYHINVDGRHVLSFPYREDFSLEDATGLFIGGYIDAAMVMATGLPLSNTSVPLTETLELSEFWRASTVPDRNFELFIGISSTSSHFGERMAVRKTWMQSPSIRHGRVVARFFVALCADNYINLQLKQEADFYGDMVIVPFIDRYQLVVLKTIAICEYGTRNISAMYIMKCDDDTFTNVETILSELEKTPYKQGLYMGNINRHHSPQRKGKWAVSYTEWPEDEYPLYADGPGYVISADIARFIVAHKEKRTLRMFKMEDVSVGLWVSQFAISNPVYYVHHSKFCQWGCVDDYYTAHYMSPRQMSCMWDKLLQGKAACCNGG